MRQLKAKTNGRVWGTPVHGRFLLCRQKSLLSVDKRLFRNRSIFVFYAKLCLFAAFNDGCGQYLDCLQKRIDAQKLIRLMCAAVSFRKHGIFAFVPRDCSDRIRVFQMPRIRAAAHEKRCCVRLPGNRSVDHKNSLGASPFTSSKKPSVARTFCTSQWSDVCCLIAASTS